MKLSCFHKKGAKTVYGDWRKFLFKHSETVNMDTKGTMKNEKATREIKQDTSIIKLNSLWLFTCCLMRFRFYTWKKYMYTVL